MGLCDRRRGGRLIRDGRHLGKAPRRSHSHSFSANAGPISSEVLRGRYIESRIKAL
jgi:hypothetical protein